MPKTTDYYDLLGVSRTATKKEIQSAFRKLARQYHPDAKPGDKEAEKRFKEISQAHEVLSNVEKRKLYDSYGSDWQAAQAAGATGARSAGGGPRVQYQSIDPEELNRIFGGDGRDVAFGDLFGSIFGARDGARASAALLAPSSAAGGGGGPPRPRAKAGGGGPSPGRKPSAAPTRQVELP